MADGKIQHTIRRSIGATQYDYDTLILSADGAAELNTLYEGAKLVPALAHFFGVSDTAAAGAKMAQAFNGTTEAELPVCPECGGRMNDKRANKKSPRSPDFTCAQEKGACKKGNYPTGVWVEKSDKGRDS